MHYPRFAYSGEMLLSDPISLYDGPPQDGTGNDHDVSNCSPPSVPGISGFGLAAQQVGALHSRAAS